MLVERRNCRRNPCFWKLQWLISCKMRAIYSCVTYFYSWSFLAVNHFVILCSGYRLAEGIWKNCKEVVDLRFVHPNAAQLSGIFFPISTDTKLVYKLVGTLFTSCWRVFLSGYFSFACQICAHARFLGKIKINASRLYDLYFVYGKNKETNKH